MLEPHLLKSKDVHGEKHIKSNKIGVISKRNKRKRLEEHEMAGAEGQKLKMTIFD